MAYASSISDALVHIPEVAGNLDGTTVITDTQATVLWDAANREINCALEGAGVTTPLTPSSSEGYKLVAAIERLFTSGQVLRAIHGVADGTTSAQSDALLSQGQAMLDKIVSDTSILTALGVTSTISDSAKSDSYARNYPESGRTLPSMPSVTFTIEDEI